MARSLLYKSTHSINEHISIVIPTVGDIMEHEEDYYGAVTLIVSTPYDLMVPLDDANIDFTKITDWELFCLLFNELKQKDTSLIFGDLKLCDFETAVNQENGSYILVNRKTGAIINRAIYYQIANFLRRILSLEKNNKRPANEEAKQYLLKKARKKIKRQREKEQESQLENYIVALVNTSEFPYDYESVKNISIYQFYSSLRQIIKKVKFDNLMIGCYAGTVKVKEISSSELTWIPI